MIDITNYSDNELSINVYNDEELYSMRTDKRLLMLMINSFFMYTDAQMEVLEQDLLDEDA